MGSVGNRFSDLIETMENELYKKVFRQEVEKKIITLQEIRDFFEKQKLVVEGAEKCMISVNLEIELDPKGSPDKYKVRQIILDAEGNPINKTANSYYGRTLVCDDIELDLLKLMNGNKKIIID